MKKFLLVLFTMFCFTAFSQNEGGVIPKGSKLVSGGFCFDTDSDKESTSFYSMNMPLAAYFLHCTWGWHYQTIT